jgi:hypothetical protein
MMLHSAAQLNLSSPWENFTKLLPYLFMKLNLALPNLTLPNKFHIPLPNPDGAPMPYQVLSPPLT